MGAPNTSAIPAVIAPNVVGRAFSDPACGEIMKHWRDGRLRPVVNRTLLARYLKLLRGLGLGDATLRRWGWWFSAKDRVLFLPETSPFEGNAVSLCNELAGQGEAEWIVFSNPSGLNKLPSLPAQSQAKWIAVEDWRKLQITQGKPAA